MFEPQKRRRFEKTFFHFTRLEEHFLEILKRMLYHLCSEDGEQLRLLVCARRRSSPRVEMYASVGRSQQLVTLQVHGLKPVRYHIQTDNTALGRRLRNYFSLALDEGNLNLSASSLTGRTLNLVYHVYYPEEILRRLGA